MLEIGRAEASLTWLVDDGFPRRWRELRNDLPARLASHEHAAARPRIADAHAGFRPPGPPSLVGRKVRQIGAVTFSRVVHGKSPHAERRENTVDRLDARAGQRDVVPEQIDVSALAAKVRLHVDDNESRVVTPQIAVERPRVGYRRHVRHLSNLDSKLTERAF